VVIAAVPSANVLEFAALPTSVAPYIALIAAGFAIGIAGHVIRSRMLIIAGILIVGAVSVIVAFVIGKLD
jgi:hypothetical protein